jgi:hypothetical protein
MRCAFPPYGLPVKYEKTGETGFSACAWDSRGRLSSISEGTFQTSVLTLPHFLTAASGPKNFRYLP